MSGLRTWLAERAPIAEIVQELEHKRVPQHRHSIYYYAGGAALFFFMVQVVTGALLLMYYRPSAGEAYESVQFIMARVPFGWLIRSIHSWSANLMVGTVFIHLFSVLFLSSYRRPRELTWMSGSVSGDSLIAWSRRTTSWVACSGALEPKSASPRPGRSRAGPA